MATTIDQRIVEMKFDNKQFEQNVSTSMGTLDKLKQALKFDGASKGLQEISGSMKGFDASPMASAVENVKLKFSALQIAGMTAISELTKGLINAGKNIASSTIGQIFSGGKQRTVNLENAKFQLEGLHVEWEKIKDDIDYAVDGTAYGMDAAAVVASQLVASNVEIGDSMKTALRGISGLAAMTNSSYEDIGRIFTTVAGNGRLMGDQLNQISSRGINAAAELGKALGKSEADIRKMVSKGEIDFATFASAMDNAFGEHAKAANETFNGAMSNVRSALSRIGAEIYTPLRKNMIGPINDVRVIINNVKQSLDDSFFPELANQFEILGTAASSFLKQFHFVDEAGNNVKKGYEGVTKVFSELASFMANGGVTNGLAALANIGNAVISVFKEFKSAFTEIFPPKTGKDIADLVARFEELTDRLRPSEETLNKLHRAFKGVFAVADLGKQILVALWNAVKPLFGTFGDLSGSVLDVAASLGDWLVSLDETAKKIGIFDAVSQKISGVLDVIRTKFGEIKEWFSGKIHLPDFSGMFKGFDGSGMTKAASGIKSFFTTIKDAIANSGALQKVGQFLGELWDWFKKLSILFANFFVTKQLTLFTGSISRLLTAGKGLGSFKDIFKGILTGFSGITNQIGTLLGSLSTAVTEFSKGQTVKQLKTIATAVLELAAAMAIISMIDTDKIAASLGSVTALLAELMASMAGMSKIGGVKGSTSIRNLAKSLQSMATAVLILAAAMAIISMIDTDKIAASLGSVTALLAELMASMAGMSKIGGVKGSTSIRNLAKSLQSMATAVLILAAAMKMLDGLETPWQSVGVISVFLTEMTGIMLILGKFGGKTKKAVDGIMEIAISMVILAKAVQMLGEMDPRDLAQGLMGVGAALLEIFVFITMMSAVQKIAGNIAKVGDQLVLIGAGLLVISGAVAIMGNMDSDALVKGLAAIGAALLEVSLFTLLLSNVDGGKMAVIGVSLVAISAAVGVLAVAMRLLDGLDHVGKVLGTLAAGIAIVGAEAAIFGIVSPLILAFAVALGVLGVAILAAGAGIALLGTGLINIAAGLTAIQAAGTGAILILVKGVKELAKELITLVPNLAASLVEAIGVFAEMIVDKAPVIGQAISALVKLLVQVFTENIPDLLVALGELLSRFLELIVQKVPEIVTAFMEILVGFLDAIAKKIPDIAKAVTDIIVAFIQAVQQSHNRIIAAAMDAMIAFIDGLANTIETRGPQLRAALKRLLRACINECTAFLRDTGISKMYESGKNFLSGFVNGIKSKVVNAVNSVKEVGSSILNGLKSVLRIASPSKETFEMAGYFLGGWIKRMKTGRDEMRKESEELGKEALDGLTDVFDDMNPHPVITPVLDLSEIQNGGAEIAKLTDKWNIGTINGSDVNVRNAANAVANGKAAASAALDDNSISSLKDVINRLRGNTGNTTNNNTFNITGDNPREIADEVSRILQMQVERKQAVWE